MANEHTTQGSDIRTRGLEYDVFVLHSEDGTEVARRLRDEILKEFKVCVAEDDIPYGCSKIQAIANAIMVSRRCILIASPEFIRSDQFVYQYAWALEHENQRGIVSCLPVLHRMTIDDLPPEFRHIRHLSYNSDDFQKDLKQYIDEDVPLNSEIKVTQTGVGLAWSFFYGYLNIVLPGLRERINDTGTKTPFSPPVYPKLVVILPVSCYCPEVMPKEDNFRHVGDIPRNACRAGIPNRSYKSSVYHFTFQRQNGDKVQCNLLIEYATPLKALYEMNKGQLAQLSEPKKTQERNTFKVVIENILRNASMENCHGKYLFVDYQDEDAQTTTSHHWPKKSLHQVVSRAVEADMIMGNCADKYLIPVTEENQPTSSFFSPFSSSFRKFCCFRRVGYEQSLD